MDSEAEARIREFKRRIGQDPMSHLFMGLAEEYRAAGRFSDAILTLEKGLQTYPHYVSAQVALARAYLEAGRTEDAAGMFTRVLSCDPGNLLSARSLAEIYRSGGKLVEAVKKYKLYRALSGDRGVNETIESLEKELRGAPAISAERREARVQALKHWLSVIQTR